MVERSPRTGPDSDDSQSEGAASAPRVAAIVPCFRETAHILDVLASIGPEVSRIYVVDDACPDGTGRLVRERCRDPRVNVIVHEKNLGVGGATVSGYSRALEDGADVLVKIDGDGQMDPALVPRLIGPVLRGEADYVKGNRFHDPHGLASMPKVRLIGNLMLSFATKLSSGYWDVFDPTNGFTALHAKIAKLLPFDRINPGYFFESDMLFRLYLARAVVVDMPMRARYGSERSELRVGRAACEFAWRNLANLCKRIAYAYFLRDFNVASIELVVGKLLFLFGLVFGAWHWGTSIATGVPATAGTVVLAAVPIILGMQLLLAFLNFDIGNVPRRPLHPRL